MPYDFQPLWACIQKKIQNPLDMLQPNACAKTARDAFRKLSASNNAHAVEVFLTDNVLKSNESLIDLHQGDVVLGCFIEGEIMGFHTEIAGTIVHSNTLARNGFYPVLPETFLPVICLSFHLTRLVMHRAPGSSSDVKVRLACALLKDTDRLNLCSAENVATEVMSHQMLKFRLGMAGLAGPYVSNDAAYTYLPNICFETFPGLEEKREWQQVILQELMKITWHPDRFVEWCLDHEEVENLSALQNVGIICNNR